MTTQEPWTIQKLLTWTTTHFAAKKIDSARLDAELLLTHVLKCRRLDLYLKFDQPLKPEELVVFRELVKKRSSREPIAYILGQKEFYGREFHVGAGVLIPRPETEHLIDEVLNWIDGKEISEPVEGAEVARDSSGKRRLPEKLKRQTEFNILDVGSGSGCIGVTLACELSNAKVTTIDRSEAASRFTAANAGRLSVEERIQMVTGDFLEQDLPDGFDIIASNPPYIGILTQGTLASDVKDFEPPEALYGGEQGHELLKVWLPRFAKLLRAEGFLACEIGFDQGPVAKEILEKTQMMDKINITQDYSGHPRILTAVKRNSHG